MDTLNTEVLLWKAAEPRPAHESLPERDHELKAAWESHVQPEVHSCALKQWDQRDLCPSPVQGSSPSVLGLVFLQKNQEQRVTGGYRTRESNEYLKVKLMLLLSGLRFSRFS